MILQALVKHYETLIANGQISAPGWASAKISYGMCLDTDGKLVRTVCLKTAQQRGKKTVEVPQLMNLPAAVKRSSSILPNFLWDNSAYMLGIDNKNNPERAISCFRSCADFYRNMLKDVNSSTAKAILAFFETWVPQDAATHPALTEHLNDIVAGSNLVFLVDGSYAHDDQMLRQVWNEYYNSQSNGPEMVCLVTGKRTNVEYTHPIIKGVQGAQPSGASLVTFNTDASCSYGKKQNLNAPVSQYAAFAYTAALNYLLADWTHVSRIGDTTVVYWAENGSTSAQDMMGCFCYGQNMTQSSYTEGDLFGLVQSLCKGDSVEFEDEKLNPDMDVYVLGLSPNTSRLSVRFFLRNSLGDILKNTMAHYERMEIVRYEGARQTVPLWKLLDETVKYDKTPVPNMAGDVLKAIMNNSPYPASLYNGIQNRIRADREINRERAGIIKAYYKYYTDHYMSVQGIVNPEEVLTVSLNKESTNVPYVLGRMFAVMEAIQHCANHSVNTTIKDRYFNAASSAPSHVFPMLIDLAQKHLNKIGGGLAVYYDKQLSEMIDKLDGNYPSHLNIPEQGVFQLGYYHQRQDLFKSKKTNVTNEEEE